MAKPLTPSDARITLLPGQLRPVAEICGFDATERLISAFGGQRIYVPGLGNASHSKIAALCGIEVSRALSVCFAGEYVTLPMARALAAARKREAIQADTRPASEIARDWHMSVNSVYRLRGAGQGPGPDCRPGRRRERPSDPRQVDLESWLATKS